MVSEGIHITEAPNYPLLRGGERVMTDDYEERAFSCG